MIITQLSGGLGNQMFQYALGRHLALKNRCTLQLDTSLLDHPHLQGNTTIRIYELGAFQIQESFYKIPQQPTFSFRKPQYWPAYFTQSFFRSKIQTVQERDFSFDPDILALKPNLYLKGYWQSERYFKEIASVINRDFRTRKAFSPQSQSILVQIRQSEAVAIHIRRGDYLNHPEAHRLHGICPIEYYEEALKIINREVNKPFFYIFSDEPDWGRENLRLQQPHLFIENHATKATFEDMMLMKHCKHQVIANSTYSWWAAWLNESPEKIVIAPRQWFRDPSLNTQDLLPDSWIKI